MPRIADALEGESRTVDLEQGDFERLLGRRERKERNRRIRAGAVGVAVALVMGIVLARSLISDRVPADPPVPTDPPSEDLGIFAPAVGGYVVGCGYPCGSPGIYAVDPTESEPSARRVQLSTEPGTPLGWSSDGRRLLVMQWLRDGQVRYRRGDAERLIVLHGDGSETVVAERRAYKGGRATYFDGATISPDGSHVVFATYDDPRLWIVDADGGPAEVLFKNGPYRHDVYEPAFSPDGSEIAFVVGGGDYGHRVWIMDADGSNVHQVLLNEKTMGVGHVDGFAWSPAGDRISIWLDEQGGTYTFAPDGSGFTEAEGKGWHLSPDGSQLAMGPWHPGD
jgi:dipeptidyl aminopeptidase/acylaminoacyl peptidase